MKQTLEIGCFAYALKPRAAESHKGSFGTVGIIGGASHMLGAAILAGRAALRLGAGRVHIGWVAPEAPPYDTTSPEIMFSSAKNLLATPERMQVFAIGPGLGRQGDALRYLKQALRLKQSLVCDADALFCLAQNSHLTKLCLMRLKSQDTNLPTLCITPHPGEAAQLLGSNIASVQQDREAAALTLATRYQALVALKGHHTLIASPDGRCWQNRTGNAGLASGGTGDVLTGMVAALLAQGWDTLAALQGAVYIHGLAAEEITRQLGGMVGISASEIIDAARRCLNQLIAASSPFYFLEANGG